MIEKINNYERLLNLSDECLVKAIEYANKDEMHLVTFYKNASIGFKNKAFNLRIGETI